MPACFKAFSLCFSLLGGVIVDILSSLQDKMQWQRFYRHKTENDNLPAKETAALESFIEGEHYRPLAAKIAEGTPFAPPRRAAISKMHSEKKRIVYIYSPEENTVLKFLTYLLQRKYDHLFAPCLYSFRPGIGVRHAIGRLMSAKGIQKMWSYKVDISDYFNSIPIDRLLPILHEALADEPALFRFLANTLKDPLVNDGGKIVEDSKGIMAGTPVSTFLANLYLSSLDWDFSRENRLYARYSDDIIIFAPTQAQLEQDIMRIHAALRDAGLSINPKKEQRTAPGERWVYLGFSCQNGRIDVAPASIQKLKGKMRRKARALMRWKDRKRATGVNAAKAFIRVFNRKLFENPIDHELTWTRWYFPLINTTESLHTIDLYCQSCIRYLATGKHTKAAYNFRYEDMKALGYVSLVGRYYAHRRADDISEEAVD